MSKKDYKKPLSEKARQTNNTATSIKKFKLKVKPWLRRWLKDNGADFKKIESSVENEAQFKDLLYREGMKYVLEMNALAIKNMAERRLKEPNIEFGESIIKPWHGKLCYLTGIKYFKEYLFKKDTGENAVTFENVNGLQEGFFYPELLADLERAIELL